VRENHPNWWGDFDYHRVWRNAAWWMEHDAAWAHQHHLEWIGDYDDKHQWRDVNWWTAKDPSFIRERHLDWLRQVQAALGPRHDVE